VAVPVDPHLEDGQQLGHGLDLVQDHGPRRVAVEEAVGVLAGEVPHQGIVEGDVGCFRELRPDEDRLPALARAGDQHARRLRHHLVQQRCDGSTYVHLTDSKSAPVFVKGGSTAGPRGDLQAVRVGQVEHGEGVIDFEAGRFEGP